MKFEKFFETRVKWMIFSFVHFCVLVGCIVESENEFHPNAYAIFGKMIFRYSISHTIFGLQITFWIFCYLNQRSNTY